MGILHLSVKSGISIPKSEVFYNERCFWCHQPLTSSFTSTCRQILHCWTYSVRVVYPTTGRQPSWSSLVMTLVSYIFHMTFLVTRLISEGLQFDPGRGHNFFVPPLWTRRMLDTTTYNNNKSISGVPCILSMHAVILTFLIRIADRFSCQC